MDQFVTVEIDEDQAKVGPSVPFNSQRKSTSSITQTIFSIQNRVVQQKNSADKNSSVRRVQPVPLQKVCVPKINLTLKRQVSVSYSDKQNQTLKRQPSFGKLADRSHNKSVSLTPRGSGTIPNFGGITVTKVMQSTNDPRKPDCLQDSESSRQKQNFVSFKRTSLDTQKPASTKPVFPKTEPSKTTVKKQKSSVKEPKTTVQTKVKNSFQQRTSVGKQNVQSPKRMIKYSDFGKSQFRSGHEDSKFNHKFQDSENKNNVQTLETKALTLFQNKVKSERVTNLNVVSGVNYNTHQCSTINLEIQQLERGEMVVKVSSGTESDDSMSLDVDELSEYQSQNDFGVANGSGAQSFTIHSIFQMSNLNQKNSQFSQQSLTGQSKQDSHNSLLKIKKDFSKTNSRQPPVSVQYQSNRMKSPQPVTVTQFQSQDKHHLNLSNWDDANIHFLTPSVISQTNTNSDLPKLKPTLSVPVNPAHLALMNIKQHFSETHGQQVDNSEQMGGRAKTSEQMNPTESRLSILSSCYSQQNHFESQTVEGKKDVIKLMQESGVTHMNKMNSLGLKITKKTSQPKRQIAQDLNLQMLLHKDGNSRQTKVDTLSSAKIFQTQLANFSPMKKIKMTESEFRLQPKQLYPVASKCACPKQLFNDRFMMCSFSVQWLKHVEDRTDLRIDYQRSKDMYERVSNKKSGPDEKQIAVDIKRTFPEEPYFCSEEGRTVMTRLLNSISKHSSSAGYTQGMNNIAGSLLFHSDEVIAFELILRALNDYHLKEVHMAKLPGFYHHCEVLDALIDKTLPALAQHFKQCQVKLIMFGQNWIMTLFTQVIPINLIMRFWCLFWRDEWVTLYRLILLILTQMKKQIMAETNQMAIQQVIYKSFSLKAATNVLSAEDLKLNQKYWVQQLELLEKGFNNQIDSEYIQKTMRQFQIY